MRNFMHKQCFSIFFLFLILNLGFADNQSDLETALETEENESSWETIVYLPPPAENRLDRRTVIETKERASCAASTKPEFPDQHGDTVGDLPFFPDPKTCYVEIFPSNGDTDDEIVGGIITRKGRWVKWIPIEPEKITFTNVPEEPWSIADPMGLGHMWIMNDDDGEDDIEGPDDLEDDDDDDDDEDDDEDF